MWSMMIDLIISTLGGLIAYAITEAIKNKKNNRPEPANFDDDSPYQE